MAGTFWEKKGDARMGRKKEIIESYDFWTMQDLLCFCKERESDKSKRYYYGWLENYNGELYTIEDLEGDASDDWFRNVCGDVPCTVYVFG